MKRHGKTENEKRLAKLSPVAKLVVAAYFADATGHYASGEYGPMRDDAGGWKDHRPNTLDNAISQGEAFDYWLKKEGDE